MSNTVFAPAGLSADESVAVVPQESAVLARLASCRPSIDHLMDAPLPQLCDELGITHRETSICDPEVAGYMWIDKDKIVLAMPGGRSELEHDVMARYLIGRAFEVDGLLPLPDMFTVVDVTGSARDCQQQLDQAGVKVQVQA